MLCCESETETDRDDREEKRCPEDGHMTDLDPRINVDVRMKPSNDVTEWQLAREGQNTRLGGSMTKSEVQRVTKLLADNSDLFAWTAEDMSFRGCHQCSFGATGGPKAGLFCRTGLARCRDHISANRKGRVGSVVCR